MDQAEASDYERELALLPARAAAVPGFVLGQLELLKGECGGAQIDRYQHSLQTATRVLRDDASPGDVVAALLHDIGDSLAPDNHAELAASVLRPFVSEQTYWVVKHHDIFQGWYFFHHVGLDRDLRDRYRTSPHYQACVRFCQRYDQVSFDPAYPTEPLETFLPLVHDVFAATPGDVLTAR
jgi:predicted HD phosphohydrolase